MPGAASYYRSLRTLAFGAAVALVCAACQTPFTRSLPREVVESAPAATEQKVETPVASQPVVTELPPAAEPIAPAPRPKLAERLAELLVSHAPDLHEGELRAAYQDKRIAVPGTVFNAVLNRPDPVH